MTRYPSRRPNQHWKSTGLKLVITPCVQLHTALWAAFDSTFGSVDGVVKYAMYFCILVTQSQRFVSFHQQFFSLSSFCPSSNLTLSLNLTFRQTINLKKNLTLKTLEINLGLIQKVKGPGNKLINFWEVIDLSLDSDFKLNI